MPPSSDPVKPGLLETIQSIHDVTTQLSSFLGESTKEEQFVRLKLIEIIWDVDDMKTLLAGQEYLDVDLLLDSTVNQLLQTIAKDLQSALFNAQGGLAKRRRRAKGPKTFNIEGLVKDIGPIEIEVAQCLEELQPPSPFSLSQLQRRTLKQKFLQLTPTPYDEDLKLTYASVMKGENGITMPNDLWSLGQALLVRGHPELCYETQRWALEMYRLSLRWDGRRTSVHLPEKLRVVALQAEAFRDLEGALSLVQEAITIQRRFDQIKPKSDSLWLAESHSLAAKWLFSLGRVEEGILQDAVVVQLHRTLVVEDSRKHLFSLAKELVTSANGLGMADRHHEALALAKEAVQLSRQLLNINPPEARLILSRSLQTQANASLRCGDPTGALTPSREALSLCLPPKDGRDVGQLRRRAHALDVHATILFAINNRQLALSTVKECVAAHRTILAINTEESSVGLADALYNEATYQASLAQYWEALVAVRESLTLRYRLLMKNEGGHLPKLADALHNAAFYFGAIRKHHDASVVIQKAIIIRRKLAQGRPEVYLERLADSLLNYATYLRQMSLFVQGDRVEEEGLEIYRRLASKNPDHYRQRANELGIVIDKPPLHSQSPQAQLEKVVDPDSTPYNQDVSSFHFQWNKKPET